MVITRTKRSVIHAFTNVGSRVIAMVIPFLLTPAILELFSPIEYGVYATAISLVGLGQVCNSGIGGSLSTKIAYAHGLGDKLSIQKYISAAYVMLIQISAIFIVLASCMLLLFKFIYSGDPIAWSCALICYSVAVIFGLGFPLQALHKVLAGLQKMTLSNALSLVTALCSGIATAGAIIFNAPPFMIVVAYGLTPLIVLALSTVIFFSRQPFLKPTLTAYSKASRSELLGLGVKFVLLSLVLALTMTVDNILVMLTAGAEAAGQFAVVARLGNLPMTLITQLTMPLWFLNGDALARGETAWVRKIWFAVSVVGVTFSILSCLTFVFAGHSIMNVWIGHGMPLQLEILIGLSFLAGVVAFTAPANMVLNAASNLNVQLHAWVICAVVSLVMKLIVGFNGLIWLFPFITGMCYLVFITPKMCTAANRCLQDCGSPGGI